ncbi:MAG: hypothetical protein WA047_19660 [Phenylobacterium sp.]|uniref:hypothetical protein n=1 Tax=Phenylobacterium sp. TaxID=1871053 RepID=UPI003BB55EDD
MPEIVTRKRLGRRTGGVRFKLRRWFYRYRPEVAVTIAFIVFVFVGILFASLLVKSVGQDPAEVGDFQTQA